MSFIKHYIAYLKDNPERYWFKRKVYGWGWVPARWQGWVTLAVFVALLIGNAFRIDAQSHSGSDAVINFVSQTVVLVFLLIVVCFVTGEEPKWMWGLPKDGPDEKK